MSPKLHRSGTDKVKESGDDGVVDRKMIERIKEATGATEDDIKVMLVECNYDANETTSRLIDNPFSQVQSKKDKKKKRDEDKKKEPTPKTAEARRSMSTGGRGRSHDRERAARGDRGGDRSTDRGPRTQSTSAIPEKQSLPGSEPSAVDNRNAVATSGGGWDTAAAGGGGDWDAQPEQSTAHGWGDLPAKAPTQNSAQGPIAPPSQPAPIRPLGTGSTGRSMADLFKKPEQPALSALQRTTPAAASSHVKPQEASEPNGWGSAHTDTDASRQGSTLGGVETSAPQKAAVSHQPIQAGPGGGPPAHPTAVSSLPILPASPSKPSQQDEQITAATTTGLGGVEVGAPPRQLYGESPSSQPGSWMAKAPVAGQPSLGSSIMSSLTPQASSAPLAPPPSILTRGQIPPSHPQHQQPSTFGGAAASPVILPPGAQQGNNIGGLNFQFGNFGLGATNQDFGAALASTGFASSFDPAAEQAQAVAQAPSASEGFKMPNYGQPQSHLAAAQQPASQQDQQQRALNAFNAASSQGSTANQLPGGEMAAQMTAAVSQAGGVQGLYAGQQSFPRYAAASQGYSQYPTTQAQAASQYKSYPFQEEAEQASTAQQGSESAKQNANYDAGAYSGYSQAGRRSDFQPPAAKFTAPKAAAAAAAVAQTPLGYGQAQMGVPQGYGYGSGGQQQYANYPQYGNYGGSGYAYGGQGGYQQGAYPAASGSYAQGGNKYGAGGYGAAGGGYQHSGYGGQGHKQEKEHQASKFGAHNLYAGQQQLPLAGQQHYQGAGLRDPTSYGGYQNPTAGYGGGNYGMNSRNFNQGFYQN